MEREAPRLRRRAVGFEGRAESKAADGGRTECGDCCVRAGLVLGWKLPPPPAVCVKTPNSSESSRYSDTGPSATCALDDEWLETPDAFAPAVEGSGEPKFMPACGFEGDGVR